MSSSTNQDIIDKTKSGGRSYAIITILSQVFSWIFTFWVIRLLNPSDYGLMSMASFLTSFIFVFSNLGIGTGIVQKEHVDDNDYGSLFWFTLAFGFVMSLLVYFLALPNAWIFDNDELVPITQLISITFILSALGTVPQNILSRHYEFKAIALVNMWSALISSSVSVLLAYQGFGVYTLIYAVIILASLKTLGYFIVSKWRPGLSFSWQRITPFLKFGVTLSVAETSSRLFDALDKLIIGKIFRENILGLYSTALSLAAMPIDKLSPLINPVVLPMFSRWQNQPEQLTKSYLGILKYYFFIMAHIYMGAIAIADSLVLVVLGEKWIGIVWLFKAFCIIKLLKVLVSFQKVLLTSVGKVKSILIYDVVSTIVLAAGIWIAALQGFEYTIYAWLFIFPLVAIFWLTQTLRDVGIRVKDYLKEISHSIWSPLSMLILIEIFKRQSFFSNEVGVHQLMVSIFIAVISFAVFTLIIQKEFAKELVTVFRRIRD